MRITLTEAKRRARANHATYGGTWCVWRCGSRIVISLGEPIGIEGRHDLEYSTHRENIKRAYGV